MDVAPPQRQKKAMTNLENTSLLQIPSLALEKLILFRCRSAEDQSRMHAASDEGGLNIRLGIRRLATIHGLRLLCVRDAVLPFWRRKEEEHGALRLTRPNDSIV